MKRKLMIAGNWKMNKDIQESVDFAGSLKEELSGVMDKDILICPNFTALSKVSEILKASNIALGAQNMFFQDSGAYTGEISALMLKGICKYVIIGHSERRQTFLETDDDINKKIIKAIEHDLKPILCIGETLEQREDKETFDIIESQLKKGLKDITEDDIEDIIIAYEPVWAIGTGKTATPEQAEEVHLYIREKLEEMYDNDTAEKIRILYGGSVKPDNAKDLLEKENIDGALVGGASLDLKSFSGIINYC